MRKRLLLLLTVCISYSANLFAQSVPNGAFENWSAFSYEEPNGWPNSNQQALRHTMVNTTKVSGVTGFAIKIQTKVVGLDTIGGFFTNSMGDPTNGEGGMPYNQKAQSITGKYMANMVGNDSAIILVLFKKNGVLLSNDLFKIGGKNQTTFSTFTFPIIMGAIPDSVILGFASSNLETNKGIQNGSSIVFDDLAFTGIGVTKVIPNGNFELWTNKVKDIPADWLSFSGNVVKDTARYKGKYAIRLESIDHGQGNIEAAYLTTGASTSGMGQLTGGRPFTNKIDTLFGYYKFISPTGDSASISYSVSKNGTATGGNVLVLKQKSNFTYFQMPINLFSAPDSIRIDVQSLMYPYSDGAKGTLILDELQLKSAPLSTGIFTVKESAYAHTYFPNPVTNILNIIIESSHNEGASVMVFDLTGKMVIEQKEQNSAAIAVNTSSLNAGVYFYLVETASGITVRNKFIKD